MAPLVVGTKRLRALARVANREWTAGSPRRSRASGCVCRCPQPACRGCRTRRARSCTACRACPGRSEYQAAMLASRARFLPVAAGGGAQDLAQDPPVGGACPHAARSAGDGRGAGADCRRLRSGGAGRGGRDSEFRNRFRFHHAAAALVVCPRNDLAVARTSPNGSSNGDSGPNRRNASQIKRQLVQGTHH